MILVYAISMKKRYTVKSCMSLIIYIWLSHSGTLCFAQTPEKVNMKYNAYQVYAGDDLGVRFLNEYIGIKIWSPEADSVRINLYADDQTEIPSEQILFKKSENGAWSVRLPNEHRGQYYTVQAQLENTWGAEVPDPYARAVGTNGKRGQLIDPSKINPKGWDIDWIPEMPDLANILIYELHIRDFSIHPESGMKNKGKYLAFTERGTSTPKGITTGVEHLIEMGITHVHLLPTFDFLSIDESKPEQPQYNWGYDPLNYNVPEGSYSTNPADGSVRILEFKQMVKSLHDAGIRVIMDVVYNHTGRTEGLPFDELVPGYYYRQWNFGKYSNASGCGNEIASERPMVRKFMVESLKYWMEEYHIDGFRFDLMAIHDQETMREVASTLHRIRPDMLLYGEGWTADQSPLPENKRSLKKYTYKLPAIAAFSDEIRDGIKGHWSSHDSKGFVSGNTELKESVKFGIVGAIQHPDIDYKKVNNTDTAWALEPTQCIAYVSCHDNHTLYDKLKIANPEADENILRKMHILSNAIVLTSQAIPFLHAGVEFMRSKDGVENSYKSPDHINQIDWNLLAKNKEVHEAYKTLIALRKAHPAFRMGSADLVQSKLHFLETAPGVIAYHIQAPENDSWAEVVVAFNGENLRHSLPLEGKWIMAWDGNGSSELTSAGRIAIPAYSALILYRPR